MRTIGWKTRHKSLFGNYRPVVLNLVGGTEPHKFHTCINRTLRSWKNKMCVVNFIFFTFIAQNILPPNPWNWLTEPLVFDRIQVKNHCYRKRNESYRILVTKNKSVFFFFTSQPSWNPTSDAASTDSFCRYLYRWFFSLLSPYLGNIFILSCLCNK